MNEAESALRYRSGGELHRDFHASILDGANYVRDNYGDQELTIDKICGILGVSAAYFSTTFKKETGKTPNAYLFDLRIAKAKRLLRTTQYSIQQIAEDVGIFDANYFVKYFRKATGKTPSAYRNGYYNKTASK